MSIYKFISIISIFAVSFLFPQDVTLSLNGNDLNYESSADIAGFQFTHNGCVSGASGGDAAANGFTLSASGNTVLAFSFTGAVIPSGSGTLVELTGDISDTCLSDYIFSNSSGEALDVTFDDGTADDGGNDNDGNWDGDPCSMSDNTLYLNGNDIYYNSSSDIGGFQFNVDGTTVNDAFGGDAASAGFLISTSSTTVLGFSLTGGTIPSGCGVLLQLDTDGPGSSLSGIVMSDPSGSALDFSYFVDSSDDGGDDGSDDGGNNETASVQVIHNSASPTVDVYIDGALAVEDFEYRTATPVLELGTSFTVGIAPANGDVIAEFPFELMDGGEYVVVATGLLGNTVTPFDLAATSTTFGASDGNVGLEVYHGSTDAPAVDVLADGAVLVPNLSYGSFSGYVEVPAADYVVGIAPAGGASIADFVAPLSGLGGGSAVVFASGFLADDPAFGLFAALADGTVLELPVNDVSDDGGDDGGEEGYSGLSLSNVNSSSGTLDIVMNNEDAVGGFQFDLTGVTVTGASGGSAADNGFTISTSATTILGFSLTGGSIPAGNGTLVQVTFDGSPDLVCIDGLVLSDPLGQALDVTVGDCYELTSGCTDANACNYNPDAIEDDGSCAYVEDCAGECGGDAVEDCAGECGGDAVEDCAGECGGDAVEDCAGECGGDAVEDCAGECDGDANLDACGTCDGEVTDPNECVQEGFSLSLSNVNSSSGTLDIVMNNEDAVGGFQFDLTGVTVTGASGGAADNGFTISTSATTILGFSLTGGSIPAGNGTLVQVTFDGSPDLVCIDGLVLSDPLGQALDVTVGDCYELTSGCTDGKCM